MRNGYGGLVRNALFGLLAATVLVACDTAEERAEGHYQSAVELIEAGDVPRGLVELRNVFNLNGQHEEARALYARTVRDEGEVVEAMKQFLLLSEQYPNNVEARRNLAELGIEYGNWDLAETHGNVLKELAPDEQFTRIVSVALAYRQAALADDEPARRAAADAAIALKAEVPDNLNLQTIIIDALVADGKTDQALVEVEEALALSPKNRRLYQLRLALLTRNNDIEGIETTLRAMIDIFPEDEQIADSLIRFYASVGDVQGAEDYLRSRLVPGLKDDAARSTLIRFVANIKGFDAAMEEVDRMVEEGTNDDLFRTLSATMKFDSGDRAAGISEVESVLRTAEPGEQTDLISMGLAKMLLATGNEVGARSLVEGVLERDPTMVDALLMRAQWLIGQDDADRAIVDLRAALNQAPNNAGVLVAMADAHLRNGDRDLAGEMLSLAVEASGNNPAVALRYSGYLRSDERYLPAESIIVDALRLSPGNVQLLAELGRIYTQLEDWGRGQQVIDELQRIATAESKAIADSLYLAMLKARKMDDEAIGFLEGLSDDGTNFGAQYAILQAHLAANDAEAAMAYVTGLVEEDPENPNKRFMLAAASAATGDLEQAEREYRNLIDSDLGTDGVWVEYLRVLGRVRQPEDVMPLVDEALAAHPTSAQLLWMKASYLERGGQLEEAVEVYDKMYQLNSNAPVVANNLASLISILRDDDESLQRAYSIARRLRDSDVPAFQDTYGWIAYRRGEYQEALRHLEPAAEALTDQPLVQYHLAMTYTALEQNQKALEYFRKALELAGDDPSEAYVTARQKVEELQ